jgi:hypothetical protein
MKPLFYFDFQVTPCDMGDNYFVGVYGENAIDAAEKVLSVGLWIIENDTESLIKKISNCFQVSDEAPETDS